MSEHGAGEHGGRERVADDQGGELGRRDAAAHAGRLRLELTVNGRRQAVAADPRLTLVDLLRGELGLHGTHVGCRSGDCGACTVSVDGEIVKSCLILAASADGATIRTIEGLAPEGELSPLQQAFWDEYGFQCGYCLPGMLFAAEDLLRHTPDPSEAEIRHAIDGNLCRCTGYHGIVRAIRAAAMAASGAQAGGEGAAGERTGDVVTEHTPGVGTDEAAKP
jgi:carbon-monoxide dehydrogenase small subunit